MNSIITIVWALELYSFINVEAKDLFFDPSYIFFYIYAYDDTGNLFRPYT